MFCPRCSSNQWDAQNGSCRHCGFTVQTATFPKATELPNPLSSNMHLRNGRYSLREKVAQRSWFSGVDEIHWVGRDFRSHGEVVMLCEIILPDAYAISIRAMLRDITRTLISVGNHSAFPILKDAFDEQGHVFFVFEYTKGESLQTRLQRLRRPLTEQEALDMCEEISAALEVLAYQSPPLVHGCICPEHVYFSSSTSRPVLSHLSPLIAGGDTRFLQGIRGGWHGPFCPPEFSQGVLDMRSDIYSFLATAYYAVTGTAPSTTGGVVPHARHMNAALSLEFETVLIKGLYPALSQRYRHPSELHQDIQVIKARTTSGHLAPLHAMNTTVPLQKEADYSFDLGNAVTQDVPHSFPIKLDVPELDAPEKETLLPAAEALPPMREGNDRLEAVFLLVATLLGFTVITVLGALHV